MRLIRELEEIATALESESAAALEGDASPENLDALRIRIKVTAARLRKRLKAAEATCKQVGRCDYSFLNYGKGSEERGFDELVDLASTWRDIVRGQKNRKTRNRTPSAD